VATAKRGVHLARRVGYVALALTIPLVLFAIGYVFYVRYEVAHGVARESGTLAGLGVRAETRIVRDDRGIPHIRAGSLHDAFFAEGYATASDRLFQMDLARRFVLGRLGELVGGSALESDRTARIVDVKAIVAASYAQLAPADRDLFDAYAAGVNAAATHEPTPPEYKALGYVFLPWTAQDSLAVAFAQMLDASGTWDAVKRNDAVMRAIGKDAAAAFFSPSDPAWDTPTTGGAPAPIAPLPPLDGVHPPADVSWNGRNRFDGLGSNAWVAGADHTTTHRALLANDPHLVRGIPGIWYLVDVEAPGFHVAGATFAGVPGVVLGHNDTIAWGETNGTVAAPRVFRETFTTTGGSTYRAGATTLAGDERKETFGNRLGNPEHRTYVRTRHGFVIEDTGLVRTAVQWDPDIDRRSPAAMVLGLDRANSIEAALHVLATDPGPAENIALASTDGRAAYVLAGRIPLNAAWGLQLFDGASTPPSPLQFVPFAQLPQLAPARGVLAVNANNRPYATGYPYRLSAAFDAPYRAAEIVARLRAANVDDPDGFRSMQADTESVGERELAQMIVAALRGRGTGGDADLTTVERDLATFDGRFDSDSVGATLVQRIRVIATHDLIADHLSADAAAGYLVDGPAFVTLMRALRESPHGWFPHDDRDAFLVDEVRRSIQLWGGLTAMAQPYGAAYPVVARHPLASFGYHGWDAPSVPGRGGSYAPALQGLVLGQSFRAVWDVGAWDAGGIDIPLGESGEPGSPHYLDLAPRYAAHALTPLPYSDAAVARAARATLTLTP
jgi:penicillin amidase